MPTTRCDIAAQEYVAKRIKAVKDEHKSLIAGFAKTNIDQSGETIARALKQRLRENLSALNTLYARIEDAGGIVTEAVSKSVYYNPIRLIYSESLKLLGNNEDMACKIADGSWLPEGYDQTEMPYLNIKNYWSSTMSSVYSNILVNLDPNYARNMLNNAKSSACFHITPISEKLATDNHYSFLQAQDNQYAFGFTHNGYIYDANRQDFAITHGKEFAPLDCSAFVGKVAGCKVPWKTMDQLFAIRNKKGEGYIRKMWTSSAQARELNHGFVTVPPEFVEPGDIHVCFDFKSNQTKPTSERVHFHGHTTIVWSKQAGEVLTIGESQRNMLCDGFGLEAYSMEPVQTLADKTFGEKTRETAFLRPIHKNKVSF